MSGILDVYSELSFEGGLRAKELDQFDKAHTRASNNEERAFALGKLAFAEYFRPDQLDKEQAKRDKIAGLNHAKTILDKNDVSDADAELIRDNYWELVNCALDYYRTGEYDRAKSWIEKALELGEAGLDTVAYLYTLAAQIYLKNSEFDTALRYIDKQIARRAGLRSLDIMDLGKFCGREALKLAENIRFSSSPELQKTYRALGAKELALLNDACRLVRDASDDATLLASMLGELAWAEYYRPDRLDKTQAARDQHSGVQHALEAEKVSPGFSKLASEVLEKNKEQEKRRKEELAAWIKTARSHYDKREYAQAKNAIEKVLSTEAAGSSMYLYWLAAVIYLKNGELDTALRYIDKALALNPKDVINILIKGEIYGRKAVRAAQDSGFSSSSELQKAYREFRSKELALLNDACERSRENDYLDKIAYTLGKLAWAEYFRPDQLDKTQAVRDRYAGLQHAFQANEVCPGHSKFASKVLEKGEVWAKRRKEELEAQENRRKKQLEELDAWIETARSHYEKGEHVQAKTPLRKRCPWNRSIVAIICIGWPPSFL